MVLLGCWVNFQRSTGFLFTTGIGEQMAEVMREGPGMKGLVAALEGRQGICRDDPVPSRL